MGLAQGPGHRRFALVIEYHGREMGGFQRQTGRLQSSASVRKSRPLVPTVQEELEATLSRLLDEPILIDGAGRTDAGVHATGQVVAFNTTKDRSASDLKRGANALLAPWIRVLRVYSVGLDFRPRFQARRRCYHYFILPDQGRDEDAIWGDLAWVIKEPLDLQAMEAAAQLLLGHHDFRAYSRGELADKNTWRTLFRLDIRPAGGSSVGFGQGPLSRLKDLLCVEVEADAFLRRMVRQLVGNLVKVGRGQWPPERPRAILEGGTPVLGAPPAPAQGLYLVEVSYPQFEEHPQG